MNPKTDSQKKAYNPVHDALAGRKFGLCSGLDKKRGKTGLLDDDLVSSMYGVRSGQIIKGKAFLGRTLRQHTGVMSVGHRVARAAGVIVDDNGKLRCPPGTPNANQFTDLNMSGCMDYTPTGSAEDQAKEALNRLMATARDAGMQARQQKVQKAFGDISTVQKQRAALAKAYPNATIDLDERFLDRISPFGRRNVQAARESFVSGLLAESLDFPEVAERITSIRDDLVGSADGHTRANALMRFDPDGVSMEISMSQLAAARPSESNGFTSTNFAAGRTDADWHHAAVHEFGHMVDAVNLMSEMGLDDSDGTIKKVRPHTNNPDFDQKYEQVISAMSDARIAGDGDELVKQQDELSKLLLSELTDGVDTNFGRYVDKSEHDEILDLIPGEYARSHYEGTKSLGEAKAEMYAFARINGHTPEMPDDESGMIAKNSRDRLQELLGVDVPGPNDKRSGVADAASWRRPAGSKPNKRAARRAATKPKRRREALALVQNQRSAEELSAAVKAKNEKVLARLKDVGAGFRMADLTPEQRLAIINGSGGYTGYRFAEDVPKQITSGLESFRSSISRRLADWEEMWKDGVPENSPHIAATRENLARIKAYLESTSDDEIASGIVDILRSNIEDEDTRVAVNIPESRWDSFIASGGVYKTTHEARSDHSGADVRTGYETAIGIPHDAPAEVRPASGYLQYGKRRRAIREEISRRGTRSSRPVKFFDPEIDARTVTAERGGAALYGAITVVMRPEVRERTKFTMGDSFNVTGDVAPVTESTDEELLAMVFRYLGGKGGTDKTKDHLEELVNILSGGRDLEHNLGGAITDDLIPDGGRRFGVHSHQYHEALIMGSFDLTDVEEISVKQTMAAGLVADRMPKAKESSFSRMPTDLDRYEWLRSQDADSQFSDIVKAVDPDNLISKYYESNPRDVEKAMREVRLHLSFDRIEDQIAAQLFREQIRAINEDVMVKITNELGEDVTQLLNEASEQKGIPADEVLASMLRDRLEQMVQKIKDGEIPLQPEPEPERQLAESII